ncbi:MAG TPA: chemotaxis protein CheB [Casimicrobiaceae bacterium]
MASPNEPASDDGAGGGHPSTLPAAAPPHGAAFPVVAIGASAGGLEAISQLLQAVPGDTGMAFVFVQHLDPTRESKLESILARTTPMPVHEAAHGMAVEPNSIYVIPRNTTMTIKEGVLQLRPRGDAPGPHLPVDSFLRSLAEDRQSAAIGVILSGTGSDGTLGLEDIKAAGGITLAQGEESAKYSGMPVSAIRSGCVDMVMSPEEIARELARIARHPYVTMPEAGGRVPPVDDEASFRRILSLLRGAFGVDFSAYRDTTIRRRIMRRMVLHVKDNLADYAQHLEKESAELDALYQDILINVTSFFREPETFETLKQSVFPEIVKNRPPGAPIRIWVPGCSTGQEAYSLAIALSEYLDDLPVAPPAQVFATDLSERVLQSARDGIYPETIEAEVTPERLRRFFTKEDSKYRVNKAIREICLFARQNVAADPPFSRVDLVSCRNLLIYLAPTLQKRVLPTFHYALNPHGFLLLGASETIGGFSDLFAQVDRNRRIYSKKLAALRPYPHFTADDARPGAVARGRSPAGQTHARVDWQREADRVILSHYAPPAVLVNDDLEVVHFHGETGAYLKPPTGEASFNFLKMAREGLFPELRSALTECRARGEEVDRRNVRIRGESETRTVDLRVLPVRVPGNGEACFLVAFEDAGHAMPTRVPAASGLARGRPRRSPLARVARWFRRRSAGERAGEIAPPAEGQDAAAVRQELVSTRDYLQSVIEEQDASNEELKSANEEILSANEELQSTNEELETAKEELQSVNEELTTINEQLQNRNAELSRLHDDVSNLLASANVPMVSVGIDLRIRRATPAAAKLLNVLPTDVGRPLGNLKPAVDIPDLEALIAEVIASVQVRQREAHDRDGRHYLVRIYPYRTADNRIDGAVVVLLDVEEVTEQAARLRQKAELLEMSSDAIIVRDRDSVITFWNHGAEMMYGWTAKDAIGQITHALLQTRQPLTGADIDAMLLSYDRWQGEITQTTRDGATIVVESRHVVHRDQTGQVLGILEINREITERKRMIDELAAADRHKNEFLAMLAHELRNPLTPLRNGMEVLRRIGSHASEAVETQAMIERNIGNMARLIDDLMDVSRITRGDIELRKEAVDIVASINDVVAELDVLPSGGRRRIATHLPAEPVSVDADPVRLGQIIENLLHNALKFTSETGEIDVSLADENGQAVLRIRDSGAGLRAEDLPRIWEMFERGGGAAIGKRSGLGIGLTLVQRLVQLHGGSVEAKSAGEGMGSEFTVRLPVIARAPSERRDRGRKSEPEPDALTGHRILVVDDNVDASKSFAQLLEIMGNEVRTAGDGPEALRRAREFQPDLVLLDIGLPGMDGYAVARELRRADGKALIVAVTGFGAEEDLRRSADAGFDMHFVKPMAIADLQAFVASRRPS